MENIHILDSAENVDVSIFTSLPPNSIVVDVRPEVEFSMYHLPNTFNIPFMSLDRNEVVDLLRKEISLRSYENTNGKFCLILCVQLGFNYLYFSLCIVSERKRFSESSKLPKKTKI